ncbi:hypothetical protein FLM9_353, partial [Candidatus Synechococcus spongiarum]
RTKRVEALIASAYLAGANMPHNRQKTRLRLAKAHVQVADQRLDHLHKLSTRLIHEN